MAAIAPSAPVAPLPPKKVVAIPALTDSIALQEKSGDRSENSNFTLHDFYNCLTIFQRLTESKPQSLLSLGV
ncbi:hypothetical protein [Myxosarcina sp. GI1(2024)]